MAWAVPKYSRSQVDAAGSLLLTMEEANTMAEFEAANTAYEIVNNWRSSHNFPLNTFQIGLRNRARQVDPHSIVAQRIKRLPSITLKLNRFSSIRLSQIQDIGGCRAVVGNVSKVYRLVQLFVGSDIKHKLDHIDDYITKPRSSGYRGVHLIYKYFSDRNKTYNDLKIEVQLRSSLQHAWATAVETVGTFTRQALKSSQGEADWLRFFALMGTAIANRERTSPVPATPKPRTALRRELSKYHRKLDVERHLAVYGHALQTLEEAGTGKADYFLLELDPNAMRVKITGYRSRDLNQASADYLTVERDGPKTGIDAVLVSVESVAALRRAYPNYFLDTHAFIQAVKRAIRTGQ